MASATKKEEEKKNEHVSRYSHTHKHTHTYTQSLSPFLFAFLSLLPVDVAIATPLDKHTHIHTHKLPHLHRCLFLFFFFCVCSFNSSVYNMSTFKKKSIHKHTKRKTNCGCALVKPVTVAPTLRFGFFFSSLSSAAITAVAVIRTPLGNLFFFFPLFLTRCVCVCLLFTVCTSTNSILFSFSRSTHKEE